MKKLQFEPSLQLVEISKGSSPVQWTGFSPGNWELRRDGITIASGNFDSPTPKSLPRFRFVGPDYEAEAILVRFGDVTFVTSPKRKHVIIPVPTDF